MWETIVGFVKKLFSGSGTTQIGYGNESISGITANDNKGNIVIGNKGTVALGHPAPPPKTPEVDVGCAVTNHHLVGMINIIGIKFRNITDRSIFITSIMLELSDNQSLFVKQDKLTGEINGAKREVRSGDSFSFHILASELKEIGRPASDYTFAVVHDAAGGSYKTEPGKLEACVADLLKT